MTREVLHFTDSPGFGGAEQALLQLLARLDRGRWRPRLMLHALPGVEPLAQGARALDVPVEEVPPMPEGLRGAGTAAALTLRLRRRRPAVFHAHLTWPFACKWALVAAVAARVPAVVTTIQLYVDVPVGPSRRLQMALVSRGVDRLVAVSRHTADEMTRGPGWPPSRVTVIPNAVDLARFRPPPVAAGRDASPPAAVALVPARLDAQKGHHHLLRAAVATPFVRYRCAGDGPERARLEALAAELGVADRVEFLGHCTDMPALMAGADLVVLPSLYEGLPLSLAEAMAAGRPVVATDVGGTREIVADGRTGLLVPPGDPTALAAAISTVARDRSLAAAFGAAGRRRVEQRFGADVMAARTQRLYAHLLERAGHR